MVIVFNKSHIETDGLRASGLFNQPARIGDAVIPPGKGKRLRGTPNERAEVSRLLFQGVLEYRIALTNEEDMDWVEPPPEPATPEVLATPEPATVVAESPAEEAPVPSRRSRA